MDILTVLYNIKGMCLFPYVMKSRLLEDVVFELSDEIANKNNKRKSKKRANEIINKMKGI